MTGLTSDPSWALNWYLCRSRTLHPIVSHLLIIELDLGTELSLSFNDAGNVDSLRSIASLVLVFESTCTTRYSKN